MGIETAEVSLLGDREDNQDRHGVFHSGDALLLVVLDGMGGHAGGARAAEAALESLEVSFRAADPAVPAEDFLRDAVGEAHRAVAELGDDLPLAGRPRATCAVCLVREGKAAWAHVGDARIYLLRDAAAVVRTRDHTPIEQLLQDGLISEAEVMGHPMRHYVEYCLGGFSELPEIAVSGPTPLQVGDVLLLCSDGLWAGVSEADLAASARDADDLANWLARLAARAVRATTPHSDNTTAVALRVVDDKER